MSAVLPPLYYFVSYVWPSQYPAIRRTLLFWTFHIRRFMKTLETNNLSVEAIIAPCSLVSWPFLCCMYTLMWTSFSLFDWFLLVLLIRLNPDVSGSSVAERVKRGMEPFLRCAALFFNCLTGVNPPEELSSTAGRWRDIWLQLNAYGDSRKSSRRFGSLQLPLKDRWRHYAATWHFPPMFSSSSRSTETPLLHCCRGRWWTWGKDMFIFIREFVWQCFWFLRWCGNPAVTKALRGKIQTVR